MSIAAVLRELMAAGIQGEALIAAVERIEASGPPPADLISPDLRRAVILRDGYVCTYCRCDVEVPQLDHVLPRSRGGPTTLLNLVVSCKSCNSSKRDRTPEEWRR